MISYTITVQKTQGQYQLTQTRKFVESNNGQVSRNYNEERETRIKFTQSDGASSSSESYNFFASGSAGEFGLNSVSITNSNSFTQNSDLAITIQGSAGTTELFDGEVYTYTEGGTTDNGWSLSPTTISAATWTTSETTRNVSTTVTTPFSGLTATTTQAFSETTSRLIVLPGLNQTQKTTTRSRIPTTIATTKSIEVFTQLVVGANGVQFPPRDTATVFQDFKNEIVWIPNVNDLHGAGPLALSDIAASYTHAVTALPVYTTIQQKVIDKSESTFPENIAISKNFTVSTLIPANETVTYWKSNSTSGFPLISSKRFPGFVGLANGAFAWMDFTTTTQELTYLGAENNSALTEEVTFIDSHPNKAVQIINHGQTYQIFPVTSFTTTRYAGTWATTSSYSFTSSFSDDVSKRITEQAGVTIVGTNVERILIRAFHPAAVYHLESSFTGDESAFRFSEEAWGLYGKAAQSLISADAELNWKTFAELYRGVLVPYPSISSWQSISSSFAASILGNAITITTSTGSGSAAKSASSTYEFQGEEPARIYQNTKRDFFTVLGDLPQLSFFGPYAATGFVQTQANPGVYVQIVKDSNGRHNLLKTTLESNSYSTISSNVIFYRDEKSFYTTSDGDAFVLVPRHPIPQIQNFAI